MIAVEINGVVYTNIASCSPSVVYDYYYDVQTMDGKRHRDIKGKRTNYDIVFYNKNYVEYDLLKSLLLDAEDGIVKLKVPNGANGANDEENYIEGEYLCVVKGDDLKGKLSSGEYYHTGLSVEFEKVGYDE